MSPKLPHRDEFPAVHTVLALATPALTAQKTQDRAKVSKFGAYRGYSKARFTRWVTTSRYVKMSDGTKLAVEVTRPAVNGVAVEEKLPVVWTHSRYHRNPSSLIKFMNPGARFGRHGYVIASVGVRGSGASCGSRGFEYSPTALCVGAISALFGFAEQGRNCPGTKCGNES